MATASAGSDKDSVLADSSHIPSTPEQSTAQLRSVAQAEIIDKWKKKFTFGLRSENTEQTPWLNSPINPSGSEA